MITFLRIVRRARDFLVKFTDPAVTDVEHGPWPHLFHFSLRARCTAMLAGLRTLIQTTDRISIGAVYSSSTCRLSVQYLPFSEVTQIC
jgi:hypothetical protein